MLEGGPTDCSTKTLGVNPYRGLMAPEGRKGALSSSSAMGAFRFRRRREETREGAEDDEVPGHGGSEGSSEGADGAFGAFPGTLTRLESAAVEAPVVEPNVLESRLKRASNRSDSA